MLEQLKDLYLVVYVLYLATPLLVFAKYHNLYFSFNNEVSLVMLSLEPSLFRVEFSLEEGGYLDLSLFEEKSSKHPELVGGSSKPS